MRRELTWTHYRLLLKVDKPEALDFYINECIDGNWSTRELSRQLGSMLYERTLLNKDKMATIQDANKQAVIQKAQDIIKDPLVLEFLDLDAKEKHKEKELEAALINKLQEFMLELGKGFAFIGRQKRISIDTDHYYIDLVFYNYHLKCFVLIDLKTDTLNHQDIGQMDFYVRYYEQEEKLEGDNPTIGLILCADKKEAMVKYTLLNDNNQVFASKYQTYFPSEKQLQDELAKERERLEQN